MLRTALWAIGWPENSVTAVDGNRCMLPILGQTTAICLPPPDPTDQSTAAQLPISFFPNRVCPTNGSDRGCARSILTRWALLNAPAAQALFETVSGFTDKDKKLVFRNRDYRNLLFLRFCLQVGCGQLDRYVERLW